MKIVGFWRVDENLIGVQSKIAGTMATLASAILILTLNGKMEFNGPAIIYLVSTAFSIPVLAIYSILSLQVSSNDHIPDKVNHYMSHLFSFGVAGSIAVYIFLLFAVSLWAGLGFLAGSVMSIILYGKSITLISKV